MKQKAFTLVELIMVIVILGIIVLVAVPTVTSIINDSKTKAQNEQKELIEDTARTYFASNPEDLPIESGKSTCITVATLKSEGLLSNDDIVDPKTREKMKGGVLVTYNGKKYTYQYQSSC